MTVQVFTRIALVNQEASWTLYLHGMGTFLFLGRNHGVIKKEKGVQHGLTDKWLQPVFFLK
jgi:hypothetical protein